MIRSSIRGLVLPAVVLAALGCLQPGIDPVFLTLLTAAHGLGPELHGWVVSASQTGMALGALASWRWGQQLPEWHFAVAAALAVMAALATAVAGDFPALLVLRGMYGTAMGVIYTHAVSAAAASRPHGAYGAVFLFQLALSSSMALALPAIADAAAPQWALVALAFAPLCALCLTIFSVRAGRRQPAATPPMVPAGADATLRVWATAASGLLFICSTMMVWTFSGALAVEAGLSDGVVGTAVALGSLAGAVTALLVMRETAVVPPALTGVLAGLSLLSPIVATSAGGAVRFILAIVLLNIGSTAIIVRTSGFASAASRSIIFRRFIACTHPLGMILGPVTGSIATMAFGRTGLGVAALASITAACLLLVAGQSRPLVLRRAPGGFRRTEPSRAERFMRHIPR